MILAAVFTLLVGFFVWMSVGTIETTVEVGVSTQNHNAEVAIKSGDATIGKDMVLRIGDLELKNVTFGYSKLKEPLIEGFSLTLAQGGFFAELVERQRLTTSE